VQIHSNFSLQKLNSFGFSSYAEFYTSVANEHEVLEAIAFATEKQLPWRILGGGSNVVLEDHLPGLTIQMEILGKKLVNESPTHYFIDCGAGENWHTFVEWTIGEGYPGLENLALIPGTTGAAPIQNIGAYGAEVSTFIDSVEVLDIQAFREEQNISTVETENSAMAETSSIWQVLPNEHCEFSYRDSIFKKDSQRYIVTQVRFAIPKKWQVNLHYAELANYFLHHPPPSAQDIFEAVVTIRNKKLPNPVLLGNAGSFFQNPVVDAHTHQSLKEQFSDLVSYPAPDTLGEKQFKLAAGWLIDACGLKGYRMGTCGVYEKQALVLVNYGSSSASELHTLANLIKERVFEKFGVRLQQEPVNMPSRDTP
jgi:UDP-N-acetylmuramate dehydrogenase